MRVSQKPSRPNLKTMETMGQKISTDFAGLVEPVIRIVQAKQIPGVRENADDTTWLTKRGDRGRNSGFISKAMSSRLPILGAMDHDFRALGDTIWDERTVDAAAKLLIPLLDIAERTCFGYYGHQHRTMQYAEMLLDQMSVNESERALQLLGALMHDIGKAAVPGHILREDETLTKPQISIINMHPIYGGAILLAVFASLAGIDPAHRDTIADIVLHHHERDDGEGYPGKIKRGGISIGASITCFCDALDTMTSDRIYDHGVKSFDDAMEDARSERGAQFKAEVVDRFLLAVGYDEVKKRIFDIMRSAGGKPESAHILLK